MNVRFGIIGAGTIARKFAEALNQTEGVTLYGVASRSLEKATAFAEETHAPKAYGSYDDLLSDPNIDIVYIAVINTCHIDVVKQAILAKKPVICEKPLGISPAEVLEMTTLAEENQVLLMEAFWTKFLPPYLAAKEWIKDGLIGDVSYIDSSFSFHDTNVDVSSRLYNPALAGGALYDVGCYCITATLDFAGEYPEVISGVGKIGSTGVDEVGAALFKFPSGIIGKIQYGIGVKTKEDCVIYGSKGRIVLDPFWCAQNAYCYDSDNNLITSFSDHTENGFTYEIQEMRDLFLNNKTQSSIVSFKDSLNNAKIIAELKSQF